MFSYRFYDLQFSFAVCCFCIMIYLLRNRKNNQNIIQSYVCLFVEITFIVFVVFQLQKSELNEKLDKN